MVNCAGKVGKVWFRRFGSLCMIKCIVKHEGCAGDCRGDVSPMNRCHQCIGKVSPVHFNQNEILLLKHDSGGEPRVWNSLVPPCMKSRNT